MSDEMPVVASTPEVTSNPMDIQVTTNSAPVEQQSTETVPTTELPSEPEPITPPEGGDSSSELAPAKAETKSNDNQKKLDDLALRNAISEQEKLALQRQLDATKPASQPAGERPKIDQFNTLEEYDRAVDVWAERKATETFIQKESVAKAEARRVETLAKIATKGAASRAKHADFDTVVRPLAQVMDNIPILSNFIAENPMGTEVAYELAKNPAVLDQLRRSGMWEAGEQLLNMAARLKAPKAVEASQAQAPIKPVGSNEVVKPKLSQLSTADYIQKMNKAELARKRAH